jgi:hypothetical protein
VSKLSKRHRQSVAESRPFEGLSRIHLHAAGVDIGAHEIMVCVPGPDDTQIVRAFGTTADLYALADWLSEHHIQTVAMNPPASTDSVVRGAGSAWLQVLPDQRHFDQAFSGPQVGRVGLPVDPDAAQSRLAGRFVSP